jgi:hypothetical protein
MLWIVSSTSFAALSMLRFAGRPRADNKPPGGATMLLQSIVRVSVSATFTAIATMRLRLALPVHRWPCWTELEGAGRGRVEVWKGRGVL